MENNKLISMVDFVIQNANKKELNSITILKQIKEYAEFLSQPLRKGFFIPCDENDNVLTEPKNYDVWHRLHESEGSTIGFNEHITYQKAKEKVLFEGFEIEKLSQHGSYIIRSSKSNIIVCRYKAIPNYFTWSFEIVEALTLKDLTLTEQALKKIWGNNL